MRQVGEGCLSNKTDIKILILFLLDRVEYPVEYSLVSDMISDCGYVGGFDFAECFSELKDAGHIIEDEIDGKNYCVISELGRAAAHELQDSVLDSIREKSSKIAAKFLSYNREGIRVACATKETEEGKILLTCTMNDSRGELFSFSLRVATLKEAEKIKRHFSGKPDDIYRAFLSMATGDVEYYL